MLTVPLSHQQTEIDANAQCITGTKLNKQLQCTNVNRVPLLLIIIQLLPIHTGIQKLYRPGSPCLD